MDKENKYQEAFNNFKKLKYIPNAAELTMNVALLKEDIYTFHELVDKATPKKIVYEKSPVYNNATFLMPKCPNCNITLLNEYKHCHNCGQKLDWSDE